MIRAIVGGVGDASTEVGKHLQMSPYKNSRIFLIIKKKIKTYKSVGIHI